MSVRSLCNNKATVFKWVRVRDGHGGVSRTSDAVYTNMPCRIQPVSGSEAWLYNRESVVVDTKMFVPPGYPNITGDCFIVDKNGKRYDVEFPADIDNLGHHLEVAMREIRSDIQ